MGNLSVEVSFLQSSSGKWCQEAEKKNRKQGRAKVVMVTSILMHLKAEQLL